MRKFIPKVVFGLKATIVFSFLKRDLPAPQAGAANTFARVWVIGIWETSVSAKRWHKQKAPGVKKLNPDRPCFGNPHFRT